MPHSGKRVGFPPATRGPTPTHLKVSRQSVKPFFTFTGATQLAPTLKGGTLTLF